MPPKVYKKPYKKKPYRKRGGKTLNTKGIVSLIKKTTMKQSETKYISKNLDFAAMQHNKIFQAHIWSPTGAVSGLQAMPFQGVGDDERIGDRITILGFMMRAHFDVPRDRRDCKIAVYFVPHNSGQGNPGDRLQLFHNITGATIADPIQNKRWVGIRKIGTFKLSATDNSYGFNLADGSVQTKTIMINKFIPFKTKAYFTADNSNTCSNLKEYGTICFAPYATRNTLETDNITLTGACNITTYYKDV